MKTNFPRTGTFTNTLYTCLKNKTTRISNTCSTVATKSIKTYKTLSFENTSCYASS